MKLTKFGSILVIFYFSFSVYAVPTGAATVYSGNSEDMAFRVEEVTQGGLLDVSVPPDYPSSGWVYFTYSKDVAGRGATALARARRQQTRLTDWEDLLVTHSVTDSDRHYGSRIAFDDKGYLFLSVGDRGFRPNGQDLTTHAGSILRLNRDTNRSALF